MRKKIIYSLVFTSLLTSSALRAQNKPNVDPVVPIQTEFFNLEDVRLTESIFKHAMEINAEWLLELVPDRLLSNFYKNAGLTPMAEIYQGWENAGIAGHTLGHYLTAIAQQYAATGDKRFAERANYVIHHLDSCQTTFVNGFIGGMPGGDKVFKEVKKGIVRSQGFDLNGLWVPWYNEHKTMMGLADVYLMIGNQKALDVLVNFADYTLDICRDLTPEQVQTMLNCEFGGMNEALAVAYKLTGEKKYLDASYKFFDHKRISDPLSEKKDILPGLHSNTQIPKIVGNAVQYELTGNDRDKTIATFFWDTMVHHHSYANGGNSAGEYLAQADKLNDRLTESTCETCNTYNMLKLTSHLYSWSCDANYMDYYERALYNHILASQNPQTAMTCYFVSLGMGSNKQFGNKEWSFTCCMGTGFENHSKYGGAIYSHDKAENLYLNLFIPSELNWKQRGMKAIMSTKFPENGNVSFKFTEGESQQFALKIRYPYWTKSMKVRVNGSSQKINAKQGELISIDRKWKKGDKVEITMPMSLHTMAMPDNADRRAIFYGPIMLAGDLGKEKIEPVRGVPVLVSSDKEIINKITPINGKPLTFQTKGLGNPKDVTLRPFYDTYDNYYTVYWDVFSPIEWKERQTEYEAERLRIEELTQRTTDFISLGEMQPERDHQLRSEDSRIGDFQGKKYRFAYEKGWFEFNMKIDSSSPLQLLMTFWGGDSNRNTFDLIIDEGKPIKIRPENSIDNKFFETIIDLPMEQIKGKETIKIRFQGTVEPRNRVTNLYDCRIVRKK